MRRHFLKAAPSKSFVENQRMALAAEEDALEDELFQLERYLQLAPRLREEARFLIPPPDDLDRPLPDAPNRAHMRQARLEQHYQTTKLLVFLMAFAVALWWFIQRYQDFMRIH